MGSTQPYGVFRKVELLVSAEQVRVQVTSSFYSFGAQAINSHKS